MIPNWLIKPADPRVQHIGSCEPPFLADRFLTQSVGSHGWIGRGGGSANCWHGHCGKARPSEGLAASPLAWRRH